MPGRVKFIEHKDKKILFIDFSNCDEKQVLEVIEEARPVVKGQPEKSVLTLTDVTGTKYNSEVVQALKEYTKENKPYVKAGAVVGLNRIKKMVYNAVMEFSGRTLHAVDSIEKAKDWLAGQ